MKYLTKEQILRVAERQVGNYQFIHEDQLDYMVEAVCAKFGDTELFATLFQKAAVYAHHIITGHIFWDGNKRIGLTCVQLFLVLNDCVLRPNIDDSIIELGIKIADGSITDIDTIANHIQQWVLPQ